MAVKPVEKLKGLAFTVDPDPDFPEAFSVFGGIPGSGSDCEFAGKICIKEVAEIIAHALNEKFND